MCLIESQITQETWKIHFKELLWQTKHLSQFNASHTGKNHFLQWERKTNNGDSKLGTFVGAGNNQAVAVKRQGAHTFLAVPVLPTRWTSLQGCADWEWKTKQKLKGFHSYPKIHLPNTADAGNPLPQRLGCVQGRQEGIQVLGTSRPLKIFVISDLCCC